ncbi:MAG: hypothetical protein KDE33_17155 [Bacteroidetes bacterium]|nr:hypothetical protein [Bacteroidota bacterium]
MKKGNTTPYQLGCRAARKDFKDGHKLLVFEKLTLPEMLTLNKNKDTQFFILGYLEEFDYLLSKLPKIPAPVPFEPPVPDEVRKKQLEQIKEVKQRISESEHDLDL